MFVIPLFYVLLPRLTLQYLAGDRLQRDVQNWLSPPDPSTNHELVWKAHHTGTASWFLEGDVLAEWKKMGSFLWIHGKRMIFNLSACDSYLLVDFIAGSGKSTLLYVVPYWLTPR